MFARAALFAHIQQTLFNVETIEPSGHFSHDVASGSGPTKLKVSILVRLWGLGACVIA
jgi:hypothetical protein